MACSHAGPIPVASILCSAMGDGPRASRMSVGSGRENLSLKKNAALPISMGIVRAMMAGGRS
jgi:hypothetical protein